MLYLIIGIGGFIGAIGRYALTEMINMHNFSLKLLGDLRPGTFLANILGSLLMGVIISISQKFELNEQLRLMITVGILGSFTTFSTFSLEAYALLKEGDIFNLGLYLLLSVCLGVASLWIGIKISS